MPKRPTALAAIVVLASTLACRAAIGEGPETPGPQALLAQWIADAIPKHYEKREDWGRTTRITVGLEAEGKGLDVRLRPKKKHVPHGIWKHYRLNLVAA